MTRIFPALLCLSLAACAQGVQKPVDPQQVTGAEGQTRPLERPAGLGRAVPEAARTAEEFDVTTAQEREAAAQAPAQAAEKRLGLSIASLGDPAQPGFWIKTPLVDTPGKGRVVYPGTGKSVNVDLIPIEGADTAGSRLSLAAFRIIDAPLTELPQVEVFSGG